MIEKGKRYRVIKDSHGFFDSGDIVIALEDDVASWCVRETDYSDHMDRYITRGLLNEEDLEEVYDYKDGNKGSPSQEGVDLSEREVTAIKLTLGISQDNTVSVPRDIAESIGRILDEVEEYRSIGTLGECVAAEKQKAKKPILCNEQAIRYGLQYTCPSCGDVFTGTGIADYCYHCGQLLDWGSEVDDEVN